MNTQFKLYIKSILALIGTMVIKDSHSAKVINDRLLALNHPVDQDRPDTWKYYLNISGQYHPTDTMMHVRSRETGEVIEFTKESLLIYRDTRNIYNWSSVEYRNLLQKYPDQRVLINGILWPVDIMGAIDAEDHTILYYDETKVERSEVFLIDNLQSFIHASFHRWYNKDYHLFDYSYHPQFLANLTDALIMEVIRLRQDNTHTQRAHSYHIRQYLSSFSAVGDEFDYMSTKLRLWLYRNIRYLNLNIGRDETFQDVVRHVMTDLGFSLVGYEFEQYYDEIQSTLVPRVMLKGEAINGIYPARGGMVKSISSIVDKELPLARDNSMVATEEVEYSTDMMQVNPSNALITKVLESSAVDTTDSEPYTLAEVSLNHWIYLSNFNLYAPQIQFKNPSDGVEYSLTVKDAFIFYMYAINRAAGLTLDTVPIVSAHRVLRIPQVTFEELRALESEELVSDDSIKWIMEQLPPVSRMITTADFKEFCQRVREGLMTQRFHYLVAGDYRKEVALQKVVDRCYMSIRIDLAEEMRYVDWLGEKEIDPSQMSRIDFETMADEIVVAAMGADYGQKVATADVHAAMLRILDTLTSYSVQVIGDINKSPIRIVNGKFPKLRTERSHSDVTVKVNDITPSILRVGGKSVIDVHASTPPKVTVAGSTAWVIHPVPLNVEIGLKAKNVLQQPIGFPTVGGGVRPVETKDLSLLGEVVSPSYTDMPIKPISDLYDPTGVFEDYSYLTGSRLRLFKARYTEG